MMRKFFAALCVCFALLGGSAFAASGNVVFDAGWVGGTVVAASSSCADVTVVIGARYPGWTITCTGDPLVIGSTVRAQLGGSVATANVISITATPAVALPPDPVASQPVSSGVPSDAPSLYVVVLAGLIVGCFGVGYLAGVQQ